MDILFPALRRLILCHGGHNIIRCYFDPRFSPFALIKERKLHHEINRLQPSGHYMYRQFNIQQFYVLPTQCVYVFCVDLRANSDYFPIQH